MTPTREAWWEFFCEKILSYLTDKERQGIVLIKVLAVAIGGGIGSLTRYYVSLWAAERFGADFPYGTLLVNLSGCVLIGFFMTLTTERMIISPYWRLIFTVGFLGGLTTFSSFSYETLRLLDNAGTGTALANIGLNLVLGLVGTWGGIILARLI